MTSRRPLPTDLSAPARAGAERSRPPCWAVPLGVVDYGQAWDLQGKLARARHAEEVPDLFLLVEHDHVYTLGRGGHDEHVLWDESVLRRRGVRLYHVDRGGDVTYHGPGQAVGYPIVSLRPRGLDAHKYLRDLEEVLLRTLSDFGLSGERAPGMTGVWVDGAKIAAVGVKFTRAVTSHGFALNVNTDLSYFEGIVPCGLSNRRVTSMAAELGSAVPMDRVEASLMSRFAEVFELDVGVRPRDVLEPWWPREKGASGGGTAAAAEAGGP